jgi:hypothetical protein
VKSLVSGHTANGDRSRDEHVAYIPLANVGHPYSDGRVMGFGERTRFRIVAALPQRDEYLQLKELRFTYSLGGLIEAVYGTVGELQGELEDAYENTPEALQDGEIGQARLAAAEQLEAIAGSPPTPPDCVASLRLVHYPPPTLHSRGDRARAAAAMLRAADAAIESHLAGRPKLNSANAKLVMQFRRSLADHADELDEVDFPGMRG